MSYENYRSRNPHRDEFDELMDEGDEDDDGILDMEDEDFSEGADFVIDREDVSDESRSLAPSEKPLSKKKLNEQAESTEVPYEITNKQTGQSNIERLAGAIEHYEGWIPPGKGLPRGSTAYRNFNPGNLKFVGQSGATGKDERGFAIFRNYGSGWDALLRDIRAKLSRSPDHTINSFITEYEGGDPENPPDNDVKYAIGVAKWLSNATGKTITSNTKIKNV